MEQMLVMHSGVACIFVLHDGLRRADFERIRSVMPSGLHGGPTLSDNVHIRLPEGRAACDVTEIRIGREIGRARKG